jgi:hypothetical protein
MDSEVIKVALVVAFLLGGLVVVLWILLSKGRQRAEKLGGAFELGTSRPAGVLGSALDGLYRGYSCRYQIQYASQYDRGGASLRLAATAPHEWTAEVAKPGTQLLAKIGLLKDFEIGDRELDEHLRFASPEEGDLRSIFGVEGVRTAMHVLAASENFESVRARSDRVDVRWSPRMKALDEDPEILRRRLEYTTALLVALGYTPTHHPSAQ